MDDKLAKAVEDFITQRMDDHGTDALDIVVEAITKVGWCMNELKKTLSEAQIPLFHALEDALSLQTGEETRYYYCSGVRDAVQILMEWGVNE